VESSYLTVYFFRKLPQELEKSGNPIASTMDRYTDEFNRVANIQKYILLLNQWLINGIQYIIKSMHMQKNNQTPRSFPPPLPSLSSCNEPCISMKSCRQDGRFILKPIEVTSHKCLQVNHQDGCLQLHFFLYKFSKPASQQHDVDSMPKNCKGAIAFPKEPKAIILSNISSLRHHILKFSCKNPWKK